MSTYIVPNNAVCGRLRYFPQGAEALRTVHRRSWVRSTLAQAFLETGRLETGDCYITVPADFPEALPIVANDLSGSPFNARTETWTGPMTQSYLSMSDDEGARLSRSGEIRDFGTVTEAIRLMNGLIHSGSAVAVCPYGIPVAELAPSTVHHVSSGERYCLLTPDTPQQLIEEELDVVWNDQFYFVPVAHLPDLDDPEFARLVATRATVFSLMVFDYCGFLIWFAD